jgi:predicted DNA-binding protein
MDHVLKEILPTVSEMIVLKNPFPKRKRGNRLVTSLAKRLGEPGIDKEPLIMKLVLGICHDTNYKIRMDGIMFFKEYLLDPLA